MVNILRNVKETYRYKNWDERVLVQVRAILTVLDEEYGENRNIHKDLGGYVLLCDSDTTVEELEEVVNLSYDLYEWADEIETYDETYVMALYLLSSDYSIVTVMTKELFERISNMDETEQFV